MAMEMDPEKVNDEQRSADLQIENSILKAGEAYSASHRRSRTENKERASNRARIKDLGMRTDAYQVGVRIVKDLTENERKDFLRDLNLVVKVLGAKQAELFPDEALKAAKREEKQREKKAKEGRSQEELDAATNDNPRSDPAAGGAKPQTESQAEAEQSEGDAVLDAMAPKISQSDKAKRLREKAGLP